MGERWLRDIHAMHTGSRDELLQRDARERRMLGVSNDGERVKASSRAAERPSGRAAEHSAPLTVNVTSLCLEQMR